MARTQSPAAWLRGMCSGPFCPRRRAHPPSLLHLKAAAAPWGFSASEQTSLLSQPAPAPSLDDLLLSLSEAHSWCCNESPQPCCHNGGRVPACLWEWTCTPYPSTAQRSLPSTKTAETRCWLPRHHARLSGEPPSFPPTGRMRTQKRKQLFIKTQIYFLNIGSVG